MKTYFYFDISITNWFLECNWTDIHWKTSPVWTGPCLHKQAINNIWLRLKDLLVVLLYNNFCQSCLTLLQGSRILLTETLHSNQCCMYSTSTVASPLSLAENTPLNASAVFIEAIPFLHISPTSTTYAQGQGPPSSFFAPIPNACVPLPVALGSLSLSSLAAIAITPVCFYVTLSGARARRSKAKNRLSLDRESLCTSCFAPFLTIVYCLSAITVSTVHCSSPNLYLLYGTVHFYLKGKANT